jgi:MFS family permease
MSYFKHFGLLRKNSQFCSIYFGQSVSFFGTMFTVVALPYQIYSQTHSTLKVGLLGLVQLLPLLFTALVGGVIADRHNRLIILLGANTFLALGALFLAWNAYSSSPSMSLLFGIAAVMSATNGLSRPAYAGLLQQIVAKEDFGSSTALSSLTYSVGEIAGPAIAGLVIAHFGLVFNYFFDFLTFIFALGSLILLRRIPAHETKKSQSLWAAFQEGIRFAGSRQELLGSYFVDFAAMVFGMPNALFPAIAQSYGGAKILGLLYAAPAMGAFLFSLYNFWDSAIKRYGVAIALAASLWGISIIGFGLVKNLWLALFFLGLAGGFDAISAIFRSILWNNTVPNELRGRLASIEMISYLSGPKLGETESGLVAAAFGVTFSVISGGVLCIAGVALCCYLFPKFWKHEKQ